jgi:nucleoside permease NupC
MSLTMTPALASILMLAGGPITRFEIILISLAVGAVMLVAICWQIIDNWIERARRPQRSWTRLGLRAMIAGTMANMISASIAGVFLE